MLTPTYCRGPLHKLRSIACLAAAALLIDVGTTLADTLIGHVAELNGDWRLYPDGADSANGQKIAMGQGVQAGAVIRINNPTAGDHIVIIGLDLSIIIQQRCQGSDTCYLPIFLPKKNERSANRFTALLREVWDTFQHEAYLPSLHRSRDVKLVMTDGVVALKDHSLDLRPIMQYARAGRYILAPTKGPAGASPTGQPTTFAWNPEITTTVRMQGVSPGLFDIDEETSAAQPVPSKDPPARILVSDASAYSNDASSFDQIRTFTERWTGAVDPYTTRAFLRSVLAHLQKSK
jgi:hypothetical protein